MSRKPKAKIENAVADFRGNTESSLGTAAEVAKVAEVAMTELSDEPDKPQQRPERPLWENIQQQEQAGPP